MTLTRAVHATNARPVQPAKSLLVILDKPIVALRSNLQSNLQSSLLLEKAQRLPREPRKIEPAKYLHARERILCCAVQWQKQQATAGGGCSLSRQRPNGKPECHIMQLPAVCADVRTAVRQDDNFQRRTRTCRFVMTLQARPNVEQSKRRTDERKAATVSLMPPFQALCGDGT
jgi:hypothetical protein